MQRIINQTTPAQDFRVDTKSLPETLTAKIDRTRADVRRVIVDVQAVEGRFLDYATADRVQRALFGAARNLQELTLRVAVRERKAR